MECDMYRVLCMEAFEGWVIEQGFNGINPESLEWARSHPSFLNEDEQNGLKFMLEDLRKLFFG